MDSSASHAAIADPACVADLVKCDACLFCGGTTVSDRIDGVTDAFFNADAGRFDFLRCADCGSLWLAQRPVGDRLLKAYANYYTHGDPAAAEVAVGGLRGAVRAAYLRSRFDQRASPLDRVIGKAVALSGAGTDGLDNWMRFAPSPPARVLDYGCGSGSYLLRLQPLGYQLAGAEYDPHLLSKLAEAGIAVCDVATLEDDHWGAEFDHITLSHVLEHVPDPRALIARLFGWLKPGGTLYLELPNADATGLAMFGAWWRGLEAPRHFALPGRAALVAALEQAGFAAIRQHINPANRSWVWEESLGAAPQELHERLRAAIADAPTETADNAEFLTFVARKAL
ncbi:MAG: class I SAM-dependent methyltransferase, partial [Porphyrobacter sp.]|nr:class I SAM-dependent methyltransferase [Porphyrobacter sp.]